MKTTIYFIELSEHENLKEYEKFIKFVSPKRQLQIDKFRFDIDKKLSLFSDLFVRYSACKALDLKNPDLIFDKNAYGKPYLVGYPDFHYNISHTKYAIAIGLSETPIGVDIEKNKAADLQIAERFFSKGEQQYILSDNQKQEMLFYEIWTKKEAYIKWLGKGLAIPLNTFDVTDTQMGRMFNTIEINDYLVSVCNREEFNYMEFLQLNENQVSILLSEFIENT